MNTFPYDSWEAALADADGTTGYFTWGTGDNLASVILVILALLVSLIMMIQITRRENATLNEAAERLEEKYQGG